MGWSTVNRAEHEGDFRTAFGSLFGDGYSHFTGGVVADISHRVDFFAGRSGGDKHCFPLHGLAAAEKIT